MTDLRVLQRTLIVITLMLGLTGCGSRAHKVYSSGHSIELPAATLWNIESFTAVNVALTGYGYDGDKLALSMYSSSQSAAYAPPGVGLAGALIAGSIIGSVEVKKAQKEKNARVAQLLNSLTAIAWTDKISTLTPISGDGQVVIQKGIATPKHVVGNVLVLTPVLEITSNYMSLELHVLAQVWRAGKAQKSSKPQYSNYFHIQSDSLWSGSESLTDIDQKSPEDLAVYINSLLFPVRALVENDLKTLGQPKSSPENIRFKNHMGNYFEMGYLLAKTEDRVTFKSLRGEVKHYPAIIVESKN